MSTVSATASGWSAAKRAAIACGVVSTWLKLPRRSGSEASSVVWWRTATSASCKRRAGARVRVDVAGGDRAQLQLARELCEAAVARAVVAQVGPLQLDAKVVGAERLAQPRERRAVVDPARRAAAEADEALGVVEDGVEGDVRVARGADARARPRAARRRPRQVGRAGGRRQRRLRHVARAAAGRRPRAAALRWAHAGSGPPARPRLPHLVHPCRGAVPLTVRGQIRRLVPARVSVRASDEPAEVAPSALVLDEQRQVAAVVERQLGPVQRPQPNRPARLRVLHRTADVVVVGERERLVSQLGGRNRLLIRQRGAVEEREGGVRMQLDIGHERMFDDHIYVGYHP